MKRKLIYILGYLLISTCTYAQIDELEQIRYLYTHALRANRFNMLYPQEKVYLHFDNTSYFSGETMWFSANVVDATTGKIAQSKVLYVELLSPTGVVLQQQKLKIANGRCHGAFPLVDASVKEANAMRGVLGYPSGYYEVRAYTRSMLNFDAHGCFSRVFPVYETPDKEGDYNNPMMKQYLRKEEIRPKQEQAKQLNVEFFPEGGHLILGVENRIAFKATNEHGKGVNIEELAIGDDCITISRQHLGMGYFMYTPSKKECKANILYSGNTYTFSLPRVEETGYTIQTFQGMTDTLHVTIRTSKPDTCNLLAIALMHTGKIEYIDTLAVGISDNQKTIPTQQLSTGVYQLFLFDIEGKVYASRMLFFNNGIDSYPISIQTDKPSYLPFERIRMHLGMSSIEEQCISLAVRDAADYGTGYSEDIRTYMLLSSELKGYIEQPEYYFEAEDYEHLESLDLLMMVQGWSRYDFEQMQKAIPTNKLHYTEECLVLEGRALHQRREEPMQGVEVRLKLYSPDRKSVQEINAISNGDGYWGVNLQDFEGEWDLNIQTYRNGEPVVTRLRMERSSTPEVLSYPLAAISLQHNIDTTSIVVGKNFKGGQQLPTSSILLDNVNVDGKRRYIDFCTFQAFNVKKDAELMIDKGTYTYTVADYLNDKGYDVEYSDGETFEQHMNDLQSFSEEQVGAEKKEPNSQDSRTSVIEINQEYATENKDVRTQYIEWLIEKSTINKFRTLWYIREGNNNSTSPSNLPGFDIDIADVKSLIVYDSPHSYISNEGVLRDFGTELITEVQKPKSPFPSGMYVVEIILHPGRKSRIAWNKNTRQTTFDGYSPKVEYYHPQYPNGPIQGDADYRRTLYWNPEVKISNGRAEVEFYNNSYTKSLHISAEGFTRSGDFIVYDSDKTTN